MTVEYNSKVATASFSGFLKLLVRYASVLLLSFCRLKSKVLH